MTISHKRPALARQQGFAVVAGIVILVVLAGMAAYLASISSAQHTSVGLDLQGGRALQAARSGMDWGISRVINAPGAFGAGSCSAAPQTVHLTTGPDSDLAAYTGLRVSVTCRPTAYIDGAGLISYSLTATACNQPTAGGACPNTSNPGADYIERQVSTQVVCNDTGPC